MSALNLKLVRGIFGALVVGALGFGATQALASPAQAAFSTCTEKQEQACNDSCVKLWGPMARGDCLGYGEGFYQCECGIVIE